MLVPSDSSRSPEGVRRFRLARMRLRRARDVRALLSPEAPATTDEGRAAGAVRSEFMENSALGSFGKRLIAWVVLILAVLLAVKLVAGVLIGLASALLTIVMIVAAVMAVLWALRHL